MLRIGLQTRKPQLNARHLDALFATRRGLLPSNGWSQSRNELVINWEVSNCCRRQPVNHHHKMWLFSFPIASGWNAAGSQHVASTSTVDVASTTTIVVANCDSAAAVVPIDEPANHTMGYSSTPA